MSLSGFTGSRKPGTRKGGEVSAESAAETQFSLLSLAVVNMDTSSDEDESDNERIAQQDAVITYISNVSAL